MSKGCHRTHSRTAHPPRIAKNPVVYLPRVMLIELDIWSSRHLAGPLNLVNCAVWQRHSFSR